MADLDGKVAIITGAASGLGRATAEYFVAEGARVVIADVNAERGEALASELGANAAFKSADVGDAANMNALVAFAAERFGGLDVMCNNAGVSGKMLPSFLDEDFSDFDRVMRINLLGVMHGTHAAARYMAAHGGGSIINTSSISGAYAGHGLACYRSAKAGVIQFSKSVAIDLAAHGIRVNCILPGNIQTEMNAFTPPGVDPAAWQSKLKAVREASQPLKRKGAPADIAQAALFFASDRSAQITGVVMPVDGGITIGDATNRLQAIMDAQRELRRD